PLPALVTILPDTNTPRIPTLKQVLGAAKKPVENITLNALGQTYAPCLQALDTLAATMDRRRLKFGTDLEGIRTVVGALLKEGVVA
ncbi:MAG TPA: electron transfer flavoprotein beta subunit/FixA family protein, partial [Syntrophobacteria bacterium]|nr:electron transfer flavoprotein beta subunit/FixA family protein [Syntrophobacteria bacterium]